VNDWCVIVQVPTLVMVVGRDHSPRRHSLLATAGPTVTVVVVVVVGLPPPPPPPPQQQGFKIATDPECCHSAACSYCLSYHLTPAAAARLCSCLPTCFRTPNMRFIS